MAGQVYAIASGKGGVGKTTTVVSLGVVLRRADHTVALVDADLGMANLGSMLGVDGELTIHDVLSGEASVEEALVEEAPGFAILTGSAALTDYADADPRNLGDILDTLAESYDFVLVDTGAGMSHEDVLPLGLADRVILVTSPDPAAYGDTRKTAELAAMADGDVAGLVVTKADADTDGEQVASAVGVDLLGVIPFDPTVRQSTAAGRPIEATDPDSPAATAYRELANRLADGSGDPLTRTSQTDEGPSEPAAPAEDADSEDAADSGDDAPDEADSVDEEPESAESETAPEAPAPESTPDEDAPPETAPEESPEDEADDDEADADEADDDEVDDDGPVADDAEPPAKPPEPTDAEGSGGAPDEAAEDDEDDPLAEFEDDEANSNGGFFSRIGRLFR